jgi:hypothetical protein
MFGFTADDLHLSAMPWIWSGNLFTSYFQLILHDFFPLRTRSMTSNESRQLSCQLISFHGVIWEMWGIFHIDSCSSLAFCETADCPLGDMDLKSVIVYQSSLSLLSRWWWNFRKKSKNIQRHLRPMLRATALLFLPYSICHSAIP